MKDFAEVWKATEQVELIQVRPSEMELLYKHCFEFKNPQIVEIGSAHGASSIVLAEAVKQLSGHLTCIDSYPDNYYNQEKFGEYAYQAFKKNVLEKYPGIAFFKDSSVDARKFLTDSEVLDILFIDGMHSYEAVKIDCALYLPLLKSGGYVAFHDYNNVQFAGVKQAADEFTAGWETESEWDLIVRRKP